MKDIDSLKELRCLKCGTVSLRSEWKDCFVPCEDCGDHCGVECPKCSAQFESVWGYEKLYKNSSPTVE